MEPDTQALPVARRPRGARKRVNVLAPLALLLALVASPLAVVFGYLAIGQIRRADQRGAPLAWIAIGLGWLWVAVFTVVLGALAMIWFDNPLLP
jgi:uncharacterized membrane protein